MMAAATNTVTTTDAIVGHRAPSPSKILATLAIFLLASETKEAADAFVTTTVTTTSYSSSHPALSTINVDDKSSGGSSALHLARKYIVIGGNIDGINPNEEEDTYNMSKKERRRREREKGAVDFQSGVYKQKKTMKERLKNVNFDKLDEKVSVSCYCVECTISLFFIISCRRHNLITTTA